jgi:H+/Cl- antiporter ClcA
VRAGSALACDRYVLWWCACLAGSWCRVNNWVRVSACCWRGFVARRPLPCRGRMRAWLACAAAGGGAFVLCAPIRI